MTHIRLRSPRGFTLAELVAILVIVAITAAVLFPIFARPRENSRRSCVSALKQVQLALIAYTQDYDDNLPPVISQTLLSDGRLYEQQWGPSTVATVNGKPEQIPGILSSFVKNEQIFKCPTVNKPKTMLTYLYNDLAAVEIITKIPQPQNSVLTADSNDHLRNTGHARSHSSEGDEAVFRPGGNSQGPTLLVGAAIGDAVVRHSGGANYGFVDGHIKWMKPENVFFPPRTSNSSSHRDSRTGTVLGPNPAGETQDGMTFQGNIYTATFHVR
jgi:prepilin-type processing-associated H-X9-DG protein